MSDRVTAGPMPTALAVERFDRLVARHAVPPDVLAAMDAVLLELTRQAMVTGFVMAGGSVEDARARFGDVLALALAYRRAREGTS